MTNSQSEELDIISADKTSIFEGSPVLMLKDDWPSFARAYHLLDEPTAEFLLLAIKAIYPHLTNPNYEALHA